MENEWPKYKQTNLNLATDNAKIFNELQMLRNDTNHVFTLIHGLEDNVNAKQNQIVADTVPIKLAASTEVNLTNNILHV